MARDLNQRFRGGRYTKKGKVNKSEKGIGGRGITVFMVTMEASQVLLKVTVAILELKCPTIKINKIQTLPRLKSKI